MSDEEWFPLWVLGNISAVLLLAGGLLELGLLVLAIDLCIGIWDVYHRTRVHLVNQTNKTILREHGFFKVQSEPAPGIGEQEAVDSNPLDAAITPFSLA